MEKSKFNNQSFLNENDNFVEQYLAKLEQSSDRTTYESSTFDFDQLYHYYAKMNYFNNPVTKQLYQQPIKAAIKLDIPKNHSLIDSMLRNTLGCQQKLAQSYLQIIDTTEKIETQQRAKRIQQARKKFASANSNRDFIANSKAFNNNSKYYVERPVVDNEHEVYLKTHLIFLEQPKGSTNTNKQYFDKHTDTIAKKISQLGGIQDTLGPMESSLSKNEVESSKKRQLLPNRSQQKLNKSPLRNSLKSSNIRTKQNWLLKSKELRSTLQSKFMMR